MSLEQNKIDFENALSKMKIRLQNLPPCISAEILEILTGVVLEYKCHYSKDIANLEKERDELQDRLTELEGQND